MVLSLVRRSTANRAVALSFSPRLHNIQQSSAIYDLLQRRFGELDYFQNLRVRNPLPRPDICLAVFEREEVADALLDLSPLTVRIELGGGVHGNGVLSCNLLDGRGRVLRFDDDHDVQRTVRKARPAVESSTNAAVPGRSDIEGGDLDVWRESPGDQTNNIGGVRSPVASAGPESSADIPSPPVSGDSLWAHFNLPDTMEEDKTNATISDSRSTNVTGNLDIDGTLTPDYSWPDLGIPLIEEIQKDLDDATGSSTEHPTDGADASQTSQTEATTTDTKSGQVESLAAQSRADMTQEATPKTAVTETAIKETHPGLSPVSHTSKSRQWEKAVNERESKRRKLQELQELQKLHSQRRAESKRTKSTGPESTEWKVRHREVRDHENDQRIRASTRMERHMASQGEESQQTNTPDAHADVPDSPTSRSAGGRDWDPTSPNNTFLGMLNAFSGGQPLQLERQSRYGRRADGTNHPSRSSESSSRAASDSSTESPPDQQQQQPNDKAQDSLGPPRPRVRDPRFQDPRFRDPRFRRPPTGRTFASSPVHSAPHHNPPTQTLDFEINIIPSYFDFTRHVSISPFAYMFRPRLTSMQAKDIENHAPLGSGVADLGLGIETKHWRKVLKQRKIVDGREGLRELRDRGRRERGV